LFKKRLHFLNLGSWK